MAVLVVAGYAVLAGAWCIARGVGGELAIGAIVGYGLVATAAFWSARATSRAAVLARPWLPFAVLPVLYGLVPSTAAATAFRDSLVQGWDRALFGADVARTLAGQMPWVAVGFLLHFAYLSYYVIIYLPPLLMQWSARGDGLRRMSLAFTLAMVASLIGFLVFPVEGPRYLWPAPAGVPDEPARRVALYLLERGSARGTAFPSSHVAIAAAISLSGLSDWRRLGLVVLPASVLLAVGAVYGGFHYAADILAGSVVGVGAWAASRAVNP